MGLIKDSWLQHSHGLCMQRLHSDSSLLCLCVVENRGAWDPWFSDWRGSQWWTPSDHTFIIHAASRWLMMIVRIPLKPRHFKRQPLHSQGLVGPLPFNSSIIMCYMVGHSFTLLLVRGLWSPSWNYQLIANFNLQSGCHDGVVSALEASIHNNGFPICFMGTM